MRFSLSSASCALGLSLLVACSGNTASPASGTGGSAGSSSGGRSAGSGGNTAESSGGLTGSGGFDPSAARECGIDAGVNACRGCLAVKCCAAAQACFADPKCAEAFEPYQACVKSTPDDISRCYSDFTRTVLGDARSHQALLSCIAIGGCSACGAPGAL